MLSKYMKKSNIVAVDYDNTLTLDGLSVDKKALKYTNKIKDLGVNLTLWTCRKEERYEEAVRNIKVWGLPIKTFEELGIDTNYKIDAIFYIDDRSIPGGKVNWRKTYKFIKKELKDYKEEN